MSLKIMLWFANAKVRNWAVRKKGWATFLVFLMALLIFNDELSAAAYVVSGAPVANEALFASFLLIVLSAGSVAGLWYVLLQREKGVLYNLVGFFLMGIVLSGSVAMFCPLTRIAKYMVNVVFGGR
ncbi:MAG: hypothetical protein U9M98_00585 [Patescibacteria group bacterium]|nr:hypothetical protein [Patescibacteria group bacterium]